MAFLAISTEHEEWVEHQSWHWDAVASSAYPRLQTSQR